MLFFIYFKGWDKQRLVLKRFGHSTEGEFMDKDGYMEFVAERAKEQGKLFFLDAGEGNDFYDVSLQWYIEDLSGWRVNPVDKEKFISIKKI